MGSCTSTDEEKTDESFTPDEESFLSGYRKFIVGMDEIRSAEKINNISVEFASKFHKVVPIRNIERYYFNANNENESMKL